MSTQTPSLIHVRIDEREYAALTSLMMGLQRPFSRATTMSEAIRYAILLAAEKIAEPVKVEDAI